MGTSNDLAYHVDKRNWYALVRSRFVFTPARLWVVLNGTTKWFWPTRRQQLVVCFVLFVYLQLLLQFVCYPEQRKNSSPLDGSRLSLLVFLSSTSWNYYGSSVILNGTAKVFIHMYVYLPTYLWQDISYCVLWLNYSFSLLYTQARSFVFVSLSLEFGALQEAAGIRLHCQPHKPFSLPTSTKCASVTCLLPTTSPTYSLKHCSSHPLDIVSKARISRARAGVGLLEVDLQLFCTWFIKTSAPHEIPLLKLQLFNFNLFL